MTTLRFAWLLARKDLRVFFRDRTALLLGFLLPIALVTAFGFIMQFAFGGDGALGKATLWVADQDGSAASQRFVDALRAADTIGLRPRSGDPAVDPDALRHRIEDGEAHHALVVPAGFGATLDAGRMPELTMLRDPGRSMEDRMIAVGLFQALMTATDGKLWPALMGAQMRRAGMDDERVGAVVRTTESVRELIARFLGDGGGRPGDAGDRTAAALSGTAFFDMVPVQNVDLAPPSRPRQTTFMLAQNVSGITVMMLMFGLVACGSTLLAERDGGTLRRLLVAAAPRDGVLLGKLLYSMAVGLLQLAVLFTYGELVFHVGLFRDPLTLVVLAVVLAIAVTCFGILVAAWARTQKQADGVATLIILSMSALGGAWFPVQLADLPVYAEVVSRCTLTWWAMSGLQAMLWSQKGLGDGVVLQAIGVQLAFAAGAGLLAWRLFRRRYLAG